MQAHSKRFDRKDFALFLPFSYIRATMQHMFTPRHVAFIMDGNRRWAALHGLPNVEGHRRGYEKTKEVASWCFDRGIAYVTFYAFSTENWNRSKEEVSYLMRLLYEALVTDMVRKLKKERARLFVIGRTHELEGRLQKAILQAQDETKHYAKRALTLAINYGGQAEIVDAVRSLTAENSDLRNIDEAMISRHLYAPFLPHPDLIVRTSGEQRLSGFLTWQSVYSELYFVQDHWPDFGELHLDETLNWYRGRERRYGT